MTFHVKGQVIGAREGSLAELTLEGLLTSVLPIMSRQLVGTRELPRAAFPRASVRLFTWKTRKRNN